MGFAYNETGPTTNGGARSQLPTKGPSLREKISPSSPSQKEMFSFFMQLSSFYMAGFDFPRIFEIMSQQQVHPRLKRAVVEMRSDLIDSAPLSEAFANQSIFPKYCSLVMKAGEESGKLDELLKQLGERMKYDGEVKRSIQSSFKLIMIIACLLAFGAAIIFTQVIPRFKTIYADQGVELPLLTIVVFSVYTFCATYWPILIILLGGAWLWAVNWWGQNRDKADAIKLRLPVYRTLYYDILQYRFASSLATFLTAGTAAADALRYTGDVIDNEVMRVALYEAAEKVVDGLTVSDALLESNKSRTIDSMIINNIIAGQETGHVDDLLMKAANHFHMMIGYSLKDFANELSVAYILPLAALECILLLAIFLPNLYMVLLGTI